MPPRESLALYIDIKQKRFKNQSIIKQGYYVYKIYIFVNDKIVKTCNEEKRNS